jgi:hypothetical protein
MTTVRLPFRTTDGIAPGTFPRSFLIPQTVPGWPPSPVPPRLVKAPVAGHPLPQGGEGRVLFSVS